MRRPVLLLASVAVALVLAIGVTLFVPGGQARAAFPGVNGKIAFVSDRGGDREIYSVSLRGDNLKRLTSNSRDDNFPAWSADGEKIAFSSGPSPHWRDHSKYDIYTMDANGSHQTLVTKERSIARPAQFDSEPAFSPSGRQIVFLRTTPKGHCKEDNLYKIGTNGKNLTRLTDYTFCYGYSNFVHDPAWSPDGTKIAYGVRAEDYGYARELRVVKPNGDNLGSIGGQPGDSWYPNWSPDGSELVFVECCFSISKASIDGMTAEPAQPVYPEDWPPRSGDFDLTDPAFSPAGNKIVFSSDRDGDYDIYAMDADGSNVRRLTNNQTQDTRPDWQPVP